MSSSVSESGSPGKTVRLCSAKFAYVRGRSAHERHTRQRRSLVDFQGNWRDIADARDGAKFVERCVEYAADVAEPRDQRLGRLFHVRPRNR